jgi:hypothetical protein
MLFIFGSLRDATLGKKIFLGLIIALQGSQFAYTIASLIIHKAPFLRFEPEFGQMKLWCYTFEYP